MNVYRFKIEVVSTKNIQTKSMEKATIECFKNDSTRKRGYSDFVVGSWKNELESIQSLFTENQILAYVVEGQTRYYVAKIRDNDDPVKIQYDILVISEAERINDSIKKVLNSLRSKLKLYKIIISDNVVNLYITDNDSIVYTDLAIKAYVVSRKINLTKQELIRLIVFAILSLISIILFFHVSTKVYKDIYLSIFSSFVVFIISEFLVKICMSTTIEVNDLTNCMTSVAHNDDSIDEIALNTPSIDDDWGI